MDEKNPIEEPKIEESKEENSIDEKMMEQLNSIIKKQVSETLKANETMKTENEDLKNKILENDIAKAIVNSRYLDDTYIEFVKDTDIEKVKSKIKRLDNLIGTTVGAEICKNGVFNPGNNNSSMPGNTFLKPSYLI